MQRRRRQGALLLEQYAYFPRSDGRMQLQATQARGIHQAQGQLRHRCDAYAGGHHRAHYRNIVGHVVHLRHPPRGGKYPVGNLANAAGRTARDIGTVGENTPVHALFPRQRIVDGADQHEFFL
ncbi:hypothetical protein D3C87_1430310 [compost metagenome]